MLIRVLVLFLLSGIATKALAQEVAGKTMVARGKVSAVAENSTTKRKLKRRAPIYGNDVVTTGEKGKAQIRMTDGGMIALKANSELVISDYEFSAENGKGSVVMELVKGGLRSVTGAIKASNGEYKLKTPVGSIGIRGTHYEIEVVSGQVFLAVWDGAIDVAVETGTEAGTTLSLGDGEDYSYAAIDEEGNVTEFIDPPENFESGMSSETDDSETEQEEESQEEQEESSDSQEGSEKSNDEQESESQDSDESEESEGSDDSEASEGQEEESSESQSDQEEQEESSDSQQGTDSQEEQSQESEQGGEQEETTEQSTEQASTSSSSKTTTESTEQGAGSTNDTQGGTNTDTASTDAPTSSVVTDTAASAVTDTEQAVLDTQGATESLVETELDQDSSFDQSGQELGATVETTALVEDESFLATDDFNTVEPATTAQLIADRSGSFTYRQLSSFEGVSTNGPIRNFQMFIAINFNTLGVTAGDMTFNDDLGQWRGSFSGNITSDGTFNLDFNHASHGNNLATGAIDAAFFDGIDSILGNFTLEEILNPGINSSGSFIIK